MQIAQEAKVVNLVPPVVKSSAAVSAAYVDMDKYDHVDFLMSFGSASSIASDVVTMKQSKSISGSSSSSLAVAGYYHNRTALGSSSIANDTYAKVAKSSMSSSGKKFKLKSNSVSNQVYIVPVDADMLAIASDMRYAGIAVATLGKGAIQITAILTRARYQSASPPSAL